MNRLLGPGTAMRARVAPANTRIVSSAGMQGMLRARRRSQALRLQSTRAAPCSRSSGCPQARLPKAARRRRSQLSALLREADDRPMRSADDLDDSLDALVAG